MATLTELQNKVVELQEALDAEQQAVADLLSQKDQAIADLTTQRDALQALVDAAPTPEQLQAVVDGLDSVKTDLESTVV